MNATLKAVVIEVSGGNVRNHHIDLRGAFGLFPDDAFGGRNEAEAGRSITARFGTESVDTDIDETKAIFRGRSAVRRFFEAEGVQEGDLLMIERTGERSFQVSKVSKRAFNHHL